MTEQRRSFCPLYVEAQSALPEAEDGASHLGLRFDKFASGWRWTGNARPPLRFDPPGTDGDWLDSFARPGGEPTTCGDPNRLAEACLRQRELVTALGGRVEVVTNTSRFLTGIGRQHPSENGFVWHPTLGTPFLPGSSLKGALRSWFHEAEPDRGHEFGVAGCVGKWVFFDLIPVEPPRLAVEVMTPHLSPYYQNGKVPGDWHSPVPIRHLAVETGAAWQMALAPRRQTVTTPSDGQNAAAPPALEATISALMEAIDVEGLGAKTSVGFGRFRADREAVAADQRLQQRDAAIRESQRQRAAAAADATAFERELAECSEPLRQLKRRRKEEQWEASAGDPNLVRTLKAFADSHPDPPDDALQWIREVLESIPKYRGVWGDPEATKGKAKKPKYPSTKIRELARRLNPKFRK